MVRILGNQIYLWSEKEQAIMRGSDEDSGWWERTRPYALRERTVIVLRHERGCGSDYMTL